MVKRNNPITRKRGMKMRQRQDTALTPKMRIPGMDIMKDLIQGNTPTADGVYMVYYDFDPPQAWSKTKEVAAMGVATYADGRWGLNRKVYAYMGPIPQLSLPPLKEITPPYLTAQTFFVGTLDQAAGARYKTGPHSQFMLAYLTPGVVGDFIFCMDSEEIHPYPVARLKINNDGDSRFRELSPKAIKKYSKMLEHLRKKK